MKKLFGIFTAICLLVLTGCGGEKQTASKEVNLQDLSTKVMETVEWSSLADADEAMIESKFYLTPDMYDEVIVKFPMINVSANEYIIVKAKEGKLEDVKKAIDKRLADLDQEWGRYLPAQHELVQQAQKFEIGNYYFMIIHEQAAQVKDTIEKEFK